MTTEEFITGLFVRVDDELSGVSKHAQASASDAKVCNHVSMIGISSAWFFARKS